MFGQNTSNIEFYFEKDTISTEHGETFTNLIVVKNKSQNKITINKLSPEEAYAGLLIFPDNISILEPNERKYFPIKFIANTDFMKIQSPTLNFNILYTIDGKEIKQNTSFWVKKNDEKQIALHLLSRESYLNPSQKETKVGLFVENQSYGSRTIKLTFNAQLDDIEISPNQQTIVLVAQEKKWIEVNVVLKRKNDFFPDYNIQIEAFDLATNYKVGSSYVKIIALSNNRQIIQNNTPQIGRNYVELAYNGNNSLNNYAQLRGNIDFSLGKNSVGRLNMNADYFLSGEHYKLYDTWFEMESKKSIVRLGNVYANDYDYSISGRGIKATTSLGGNRTIEVLALENNYNLYGSFYSAGESSRIAGAKYQFGSRKNVHGKVSYLFDNNPRLKTNSQLANWASTFRLDSLQTLQVEGGVSFEKGQVNKDENIGASLAANYMGQFDNWNIQSLNSYTTKSYIGLNRGSFDFNQNLSYKLPKQQRIFLQYQIAQVDPEYLSSQTVPDTFYGDGYSTTYFYGTQSAQVGYQIGWPHLNIILAPQVEKQKNINSSIYRELLSYRLRTNISTTFSKQAIHFSAEYSYSNSGQELEWFNSFNVNISYHFYNFGINGSVQVNPKNVIELYQYNLINENFVNYNFYASYNFQTKDKSFSGSVTAGTNFSGLYENQNQNISCNLEYQFANSWATTAYGNYSNYRSMQAYGYTGNNFQIRLGVKKYFIKSTTTGNHKIRLQLFEDSNSNGKLDVGETILVNQVVQLNDFIAITDESGRVVFENVPKGSYTLKVNPTNELMLLESEIIVSQNLKLSIGLIKKNRVDGKLVEKKQAYDNLETDVRGIIVYAKSQNGSIQSTLVNQNNEFEFFLKEGTYNIYIENDRYEYRESSKKINVSNTIKPEPLIFEYSKKNVTIKVKKF